MARAALILRATFAFALGIGGAAAWAREPWTASRVQGTPEPAKPFTTEPAFPGVGGKEVLELVAVPGQDRFLAVERGGRVFTFGIRPEAAGPAVAEVIDLKALHANTASAYGAAFSPRYRDDRELYLAYTVSPDGPEGTRLSRFRLTELDPPRADPMSEEVILTWPSGGHNGANLRFGPDGHLYVSTGDATAPNPPDVLNTGQDLSDLLSSILRIDVSGRDPERGLAYRIPADNPFLAWPGARPENWAYGFRNPWKMSFDPASGDLWVGDVGWELWEMIHRVRRGGNHGWSAREASQPIRPDAPANPSPITPPAAAHPHTEAASITGGFVYRGSRFPELRGAYVYGDYETGKIWGLWHDGTRSVKHEEIADTAHKIVTFGQDDAGELYLVHYGTPTTFHALARHPEAGKVSAFPRQLSGTGLFTDTPRQLPSPGVVGYEVAEPLWQDGAEAERFVAMPGTSGIGTALRRRPNGTVERATVTWPAGTVLVRTLRPRAEARPVETQILHHDGESWHGYSYRWNEAGTDAELVPPEGLATPDWTFHSRAECARCHHSWSGFAVGFQPEQVSRVDGRPAEEALPELGLATPEWFEARPGRLLARTDPGTPEMRARSWLHANCAHCHRRHAGGSVAIQVNIDLPLAETRLLDEPPLRGDFGLPDARIIVPAVPSRSVLLHRLLRHGSGRMPILGSREPDPEGIRRLREWIAAMPGTGTEPAEPVSRDHPPKDIRDAMRLVLSWEETREPEAGSIPAVAAAWTSPDANIRELFERFRPVEDRAATLGTSPDEAALLALTGDAGRGKALLAPDGKLALCLTCHQVGGHGRDFGPNLDNVGARLDRRALLASLLRPSETMAPDYRGVNLETRDGRIMTGFPVRREAGRVVLKLPDGRLEPVPAETVKRETWLPVSLMPEGLLAGVSPQDAADLLAYLGTLGVPAGRP